MIAAANHLFGHIVSAFRHPLPYAGDRQFRVGQTQIEQLDEIAPLTPVRYRTGVAVPTQSGLEGKAVSAIGMFLD